MKSIGFVVGHIALGALAGPVIGGTVGGLLLGLEPAPRGDTPDIRGLALLLFLFSGAGVGALGSSSSGSCPYRRATRCRGIGRSRPGHGPSPPGSPVESADEAMQRTSYAGH